MVAQRSPKPLVWVQILAPLPIVMKLSLLILHPALREGLGDSLRACHCANKQIYSGDGFWFLDRYKKIPGLILGFLEI